MYTDTSFSHSGAWEIIWWQSLQSSLCRPQRRRSRIGNLSSCICQSAFAKQTRRIKPCHSQLVDKLHVCGTYNLNLTSFWWNRRHRRLTSHSSSTMRVMSILFGWKRTLYTVHYPKLIDRTFSQSSISPHKISKMAELLKNMKNAIFSGQGGELAYPSYLASKKLTAARRRLAVNVIHSRGFDCREHGHEGRQVEEDGRGFLVTGTARERYAEQIMLV